MSRKRRSGSVPWLRISSRFQPAPTPNRKRPFESRSTVATSFAVVIGSRSTIRQMPVPSSSFSVDGRRGGERCEGVVDPAVLVGQLAARRVRRLAADRDVGVLGEEERLEVELLGSAGELDRLRRGLRREDRQSELHRSPHPIRGGAATRSGGLADRVEQLRCVLDQLARGCCSARRGSRRAATRPCRRQPGRRLSRRAGRPPASSRTAHVPGRRRARRRCAARRPAARAGPRSRHPRRTGSGRAAGRRSRRRRTPRPSPASAAAGSGSAAVECRPDRCRRAGDDVLEDRRRELIGGGEALVEVAGGQPCLGTAPRTVSPPPSSGSRPSSSTPAAIRRSRRPSLRSAAVAPPYVLGSLICGYTDNACYQMAWIPNGATSHAASRCSGGYRASAQSGCSTDSER